MPRSKEDKVVDKITEALNDRTFNPTIAGRMLVTGDLYAQDRLMKMCVEIIKQQANIYEAMWEVGRTSESLLLSSHIKEVIDLHMLEDNPS